jgi:hypothetical protein
MKDLLDYVLDAHGGLNRWSGVSTLTAKLAADGPFWKLRGFPDAFGDETLTIDVRRQHAVFTPWTAPGRTLTFGTGPERVTLHDSSGQIIASLADHVAYMDTDMTSGLDVPKADPREVARQTAEAILAGEFEVLADNTTRTVKAGLSHEVIDQYKQLAA